MQPHSSYYGEFEIGCNLIDQILLKSKIDADQFRLDLKPLKIADLCLRTIEKAKHVYDTNDRITFKTNTESSLLLGDENVIHYILNNLLSNAVKYSSNEEPVDLILHCSDAAVSINVRDRGIGIHYDEQEAIFEFFQRGRNVNDITGNGLGLALVKYFCNLHGAAISLQSSLDVGSNFRVNFIKEK